MVWVSSNSILFLSSICLTHTYAVCMLLRMAYFTVSDVDSILPPVKQFLSEDQFLEIWDARGMKYRFDELHQMMLSRGLTVNVDRVVFRKMVWDILHSFLVLGDSRRDPKHEERQKFPKVH